MSEDNYYYTIDFGINFASDKYYNNKQIDQIINESYSKGVDKIISISNNYRECLRNIELSKKYDMLYFTLGIHPNNARNFRETDIMFIKNNLKNAKCFGIGEFGLDYNRMFSAKDIQIIVFKKQLHLAKECNAKMYLHCRDAHFDFVRILKEIGYYNGLVHCFSGNTTEALELINLGLKLGITGLLLNKKRNMDLIKVIENIDLSNIVIETDGPFFGIYPNKNSHPADTERIVRKIAQIKKINEVDVGKQLYDNANSLLQK
uniref:Uncharacterized protein n=1 Tax=viral metagenome TaxID=1070528 RepID=A0A6C0H6R8_9ZZZZ